ncbi:asparagine synthetase B family protein [Amycolatopsis nigrescens]|uniref:asparagine synthetase B family protein n=1 Tax=Amycolatopsis nigrescens TaxID=381445 RepID=UPI00035EE835|nr:asparagine synthetase B [Amycolatopsis nigrescens]
MSGVVGWIDFSRNLRLHRPIITMLASTLAQRGPDTESVWVSPAAALGYRGLAADGAPCQQPAVIESDGRTVAACVAGSPFGLDELRARLRSSGVAVTPDASAAELVAHAFLRWQDEFIPALAGSFALSIWDSRAEELLLARSAMAGQGLYYANTATGVVFGSERKAVLAHPEISSAVDIDGMREVVTHALPPGPLFRDLGQVNGAEIARFTRNGWKRRNYWKFESRPHTDDADTTIRNIREMLEESMRHNLPADPSKLTVMLSGGIDSSSVAALAAAELRRRGSADRLKTFTIDYVDDEFKADVMRVTKDAPFAELVAEHIGAEQTTVRLEATDTLDPLIRMGILRANDGPTRIYDMDAAQHLFLQHVSAQGNKIAFTGYGADNAFLGANWSNDKGLIESGTFPWVALAQRFGAMNGFGTGLLNPDFLAKLDLQAYYRDTYATAVGQVEHLPGEDEWQRTMRRVSYLVLTLFRSDQPVFADAGLQARSPISSAKLLQYAYNIPIEMQKHGGHEKGLLRAAVADLLPDEIVTRPRSAAPVSHHPGYPRRLQEEFKALLADPQAPARSLIDLPAATELADQPERIAKDRLARADIELALQMNLWIEQYHVRLAL